MPTIDSRAAAFDLLRRIHTIAVVGLSASPDRDSHAISAYLQQHGYRIYGVNPSEDEILGAPCYPSLSEVPEPLRAETDLVLVFRAPRFVPELIEEAARLGLGPLWLQLGVSSPEALATADRLGVDLVSEKCIRVLHPQLPRNT